jgi:hypothetical protein
LSQINAYQVGNDDVGVLREIHVIQNDNVVKNRCRIIVDVLDV